MTQTYCAYALGISFICIAFALGAMPASANHPDESESASPSHAESIEHDHAEEEMQTTSVPTAVTISAPVRSHAQIQQLLTAMMQLVELLQKQKEMIEHDATPHDHAEDEEHNDEHNDEDHA